MHERSTSVAIGIMLAAATAAHAATKMTPAEIQSTLFTGASFTAATPSGVKFKMAFNGDGRMTREPAAKAGAKGEGTWKVSTDGFCTTWKGQKENCYTLVAAGRNKWSVMNKSAIMAVWSK